MKILTKLLAGFLAVALLCAVVGGVALSQVTVLSGSIRELAENSIPSLAYLNAIKFEMTNIKTAIRSIAHPYALDNRAFYERQMENISKARTAYQKAKSSFETLSMTAEETILYADFAKALDGAIRFNNEVMADVEKARALEGAEREAANREIFSMIESDRRLAFDDMLAALQKVYDYDTAYYGGEIPRKALAGVPIARAALIAVALLAFLFAVILGVILGRAISTPLRRSAAVLDKIAAGDFSERLVVKTKDEFAQVSASLNLVADTIDGLVAEAGVLTVAAVDGKLSTRGDASKFKGGYHDIVEGVNKTLDAVIGPLNVAAAYVDRISKGDIPPKITDSYNGDFNTIKNNLNLCIDAVGGLVSDAGTLAQAAVEGRLTTRADATRHQGDFRKIVEGVNRTLDLVIDPINETTAILKRMADGDLTTTMTGAYRGDFDILKTALNDTIDSINDILGQVSMAVEQVTAGSQQVSQASQSLSQGATEQASSLEEITSSVTEIAGQTRQNTENAVQVNTMANAAKSESEKGNAQMAELVSAMSDINESAEEIKKIVKAIDDISFQINLLALNANVEAARAGKYGKGFAVVAEEVRNLAVRSAGSVKETTAMVDEAIANIARGNSLVDVTAKQLASIAEGAVKSAGLAEEVSTASREQSQGLEQISTGLNQIDQVTQANTASAEESASAAEELSSQAQQLKAMVARFKLKERERSRMSEAEMLAMLRAEMARSGGSTAKSPARALTLHKDDLVGKGTAKSAAKAPAKAPAKTRAALVNPADVISLDDDDFGKF